jgi:DNA-binding IclR family transcriptional regulator
LFKYNLKPQSAAILPDRTRASDNLPMNTNAIFANFEEGNKPSRGIQSIEVGGQLLKALVATGQAMALKDLAKAAQMTPAKAHPYLVSFVKLGLIEQDPATGRYGLGPLSMQLGWISLQQVDPVRLACAALPDLAQQMQCTVSVAVWGSDGPVIIRVEQAPNAVHVSMRHGALASLLHTGTGKIFAAFAPRQDVQDCLARHGQAAALDAPAFSNELNTIRQNHICSVKDEYMLGISAMAVPVFDGFGRLALAIAGMGPNATMDLNYGSRQAQALTAAARTLSASLGGAQPQRTQAVTPP